MFTCHNFTTSLNIPALLNTAAVIHELAGDVHDLPRIPKAILNALAVKSVTLSVTHTKTTGEPEVVVLSTSSAEEAPEEANLLAPRVLKDDALGLDPLNQPKPSESTPTIAATPLGRQSKMPVLLSVTRHLDSEYQMSIVVHQLPQETQNDMAVQDGLNILGDHLAKSLQALLCCLAYPPVFDKPFTFLTKREWEVLCALNSADGEKQLAASLNLSSNTLHSHIKSIYRKIGVQGRLPLLLTFRLAMQEYRLRMFAQPAEGLSVSSATQILA